MRGRGAFVRVALRLASNSACALDGAQGPRTASSLGLTDGLLAQADAQVNPGEGCAEPT